MSCMEITASSVRRTEVRFKVESSLWSTSSSEVHWGDKRAASSDLKD